MASEATGVRQPAPPRATWTEGVDAWRAMAPPVLPWPVLAPPCVQIALERAIGCGGRVRAGRPQLIHRPPHPAGTAADKPLSVPLDLRDSQGLTLHGHVQDPMIDRLPPQSTEAEQSILGSILIDRDAIIEVADFLKPEDFYRQAHRRIYAAMMDLSERREPVDVVTVAESLDRTGDLESVGGRAYLGELSNQTPTAVHAAQYARIVERKAVLRNLIA